MLDGGGGFFAGLIGDLYGADDGERDAAVGTDDVFAGDLGSADGVHSDGVAATEFVGLVGWRLEGLKGCYGVGFEDGV